MKQGEKGNKVRIAINGLGRIGRCLTRAYAELPAELLGKLELVAINSRSLTAEDAAYLLSYDSTHGRFGRDVEVSISDSQIDFGCGKVAILSQPDIDKIPWQDYDVDLVLECSGKFNNKADAGIHCLRGVKKVIVSAPCKNADNTIVIGVNDQTLRAVDQVISIGSCTTNCLVPLVFALHNTIGVEHGMMTTIHSYTNDQVILDANHSDKRRSRAGTVSMIPTTTGAAKMIGEIIPELKGKIDGIAMRVPTQNVSFVDFTLTTLQNTTVEDINSILLEAALNNPNILSFTNEPLVSVDFNHTIFSAIFDGTQTKVINNKFCRVGAWYDNEWAFVHRMLDACILISKYL